MKTIIKRIITKRQVERMISVLEIHTGKPYVKKLILKVRKTDPLNNTLVCLTPDL